MQRLVRRSRMYDIGRDGSSGYRSRLPILRWMHSSSRMRSTYLRAIKSICFPWETSR
jgi:hypothetical protein